MQLSSQPEHAAVRMPDTQLQRPAAGTGTADPAVADGSCSPAVGAAGPPQKAQAAGQ